MKRTPVPLVALALVAVLAIGVIVGGLGSAWGKHVDECPRGDWADYTEEQKKNYPECEVKEPDLPQTGDTVSGEANWIIITYFADGTTDKVELEKFALAPATVFAGDKEVVGWDLTLNGEFTEGYLISGLRLEEAQMMWVPEQGGDCVLYDACTPISTRLSGDVLHFPALLEPTISLDAFHDVEKPLVEELCSTDCELTGQLKITATLFVDITDGLDERATLKAQFPWITQDLVIRSDTKKQAEKPVWAYKCDFDGEYGKIPDGPYASQWKVNTKAPFETFLHDSQSLTCFKPDFKCDAFANEVWSGTACVKVVCERGEMAVNAVCYSIVCDDGFRLSTDVERSPQYRGMCLPDGGGEIPPKPECPAGQKAEMYRTDTGDPWQFQCVTDYSPTCEAGFQLVDGACFFQCSNNSFVVTADICPSVGTTPERIQCPDGSTILQSQLPCGGQSAVCDYCGSFFVDPNPPTYVPDPIVIDYCLGDCYAALWNAEFCTVDCNVAIPDNGVLAEVHGCTDYACESVAVAVIAIERGNSNEINHHQQDGCHNCQVVANEPIVEVTHVVESPYETVAATVIPAVASTGSWAATQDNYDETWYDYSWFFLPVVLWGWKDE
jgi:hypothetical protein